MKEASKGSIRFKKPKKFRFLASFSKAKTEECDLKVSNAVMTIPC